MAVCKCLLQGQDGAGAPLGVLYCAVGGPSASPSLHWGGGSGVVPRLLFQ